MQRESLEHLIYLITNFKNLTSRQTKASWINWINLTTNYFLSTLDIFPILLSGYTGPNCEININDCEESYYLGNPVVVVTKLWAEKNNHHFPITLAQPFQAIFWSKKLYVLQLLFLRTIHAKIMRRAKIK